MMNIKYFLDKVGLVSAVEEEALKVKLKCAMVVANYAKRSMKKGGGKKRTPSAPGTPPNVQKGHLRASVLFAVTEDKKVIVGPTVPYGAIHEFGGEITSGGVTRLYPERAYMRPALIKGTIQFPGLFKGINLANTKAGKALNSKSPKVK